MQAILITDTYFETDSGGNAVAIFEAGKHYPVTEASQRQVALGNGELVDVPDDAEKAQAAAEAAEAAEDPGDIVEYADCLIVFLDALWRSGFAFDAVVQAALAKMKINRERKWPTLQDPTGPVEHVRE